MARIDSFWNLMVGYNLNFVMSGQPRCVLALAYLHTV
jgi:hypothetical protein